MLAAISPTGLVPMSHTGKNPRVGKRFWTVTDDAISLM